MADKPSQLDLFGSIGESETFFSRKRNWSVIKHRVMLRYIQSFCYNLGGDEAYQSKELNYVDGFAGEGRYDKGIGIEEFVDESKFWKRYNHQFSNTDGSPLIGLRCAKIFQAENRVNLRCFFAEAGEKQYPELVDNCASVGQGLDYKIYERQTFADTLPQIMQDLHGHPTLFFLDSFGVKGVNFEQMCLIGDYLSQYKGELFLLFHNRRVARDAGYLTQKAQKPGAIKAAQTLMHPLTSLLGSNSDRDWQPKWRALKDQPQQFERWALRYLKERLRRESKFKGVASFEVKETYHVTRPQYSILVCSNHPSKAFGEFLNEFVADENRSLFYQIDSSGLNHQFLERGWTRQTQERIERIKPEIEAALRRIIQEWKPLKEVITLIILEMILLGYDLGYLKRNQYKEIITEIYERGEIQAQKLGKKGGLTLESLIKIM